MQLGNSQKAEEVHEYEVVSKSHANPSSETTQATSAGHGQPLPPVGVTSEGYTLTTCPAYSTTTLHAAQNSAEEEYATGN